MERAIKQPPVWMEQVVKFGLVGVLNTAVDLGLYYVLTRWLGFGSLPVVAKMISYGTGVVNSYCWNRVWTFHSHDTKARTFLLFALVSAVGLAINAATLQLMSAIPGVPEGIALMTATLLSLAWNFAIIKIRVFRK